MSGNFSEAEILDLIAEAGHKLELGTPKVIQAADPTYGLSERVERLWKEVPGYVAEDQQSEIAVSQGTATESAGGLKAYLAASKVNRADLDDAEARLRHEGREYQFQYLVEIRDRGILRLHKLQLI